MCELRILDERKYEATVGAIKRENEKPSVKDFERACRKELLQYYKEINEKKNLNVLFANNDPEIFLWKSIAHFAWLMRIT